ncbi:ChbG/HpnK family deacetylase [Sphingobacterium endophyticum]|uniref:ChbG/HpnK family deacetylase n=1 Tax=Sphingobacterium endophyticum TaxID=2546448 RepID=UPI0012E108FB|nr:ChbG/HpnK family deacetylase [Sphingobacterium endophyticum]
MISYSSILKTYFFICLAIINSSAYSQNSIQLIVRSDDIGSFSSTNQAIIETFKHGITTSTELMINCPWAPEAVKLLKENPTLDVGVHLMITSEWENCKWRPLTPARSLVDEYGYFYSFIYPNKDVPGASIQEHDWEIDDIEMEFRAQIELAKKMLPRISHISTHMGCGNWNPEVHKMLVRLSKEYNLPLEEEYNLEAFPKLGISKDASLNDKISTFINSLEQLQHGKSYLFIEHPGLNVSEMENVGHEGYRNVKMDRSDVSKILTSQKVIDKVKLLGIELIDFQTLNKKLNK